MLLFPIERRLFAISYILLFFVRRNFAFGFAAFVPEAFRVHTFGG
jgi:hypothetical protein